MSEPGDRDNGWIPPERYAGEQDNLEAEARRIVGLTRESAARRETLERKLRDRLAGKPYEPASDWLERSDAAREQQVNGQRTYPQEWTELARLASELPRTGPGPRLGKTRRASHDRDGQ